MKKLEPTQQQKILKEGNASIARYRKSLSAIDQGKGECRECGSLSFLSQDLLCVTCKQKEMINAAKNHNLKDLKEIKDSEKLESLMRGILGRLK